MDETNEKKIGRHVKNQLSVWDTLVECRIRLHKALVAANCLPLPETWQSLMDATSTSPLSLDSFQEESKHSVSQLTQSLLQLHTLLAKNLAVKEKKLTQKVVRKEVNDDQMDETEDEGEKDSTCEAGKEKIGEKSLNSDEEAPQESEEEEEEDDEEDESIQIPSDRHQRIASDNRMDVDFTTDESFVIAQDALNDAHTIDSVIESRMQKLAAKKNAILHEWFHRTRFSVAQGLESFEQPPLTQITAILANKKRLIKRTQLKRCEYNLVGATRKSTAADVKSSVDQADSQQPETSNKGNLSNLVAYESRNDQESNYDAEIFNDDDFYHQLLKELIDTKAADSNDSQTLSKKWQAIQKMRGKMRKVDTRASKGRKIRFKVHKEIINFMAPVPLTSMDETARNALFTSVFSH